MRPSLPPNKKRKMVSFMISPECALILEDMFSAYRKKVFRRFTKTDLFEMGIRHLSQEVKKKSMVELYNKYIEGEEINLATQPVPNETQENL